MYEIGLLPNKQRYGITKVIENSEAWKEYKSFNPCESRTLVCSQGNKSNVGVVLPDSEVNNLIKLRKRKHFCRIL